MFVADIVWRIYTWPWWPCTTPCNILIHFVKIHDPHLRLNIFTWCIISWNYDGARINFWKYSAVYRIFAYSIDVNDWYFLTISWISRMISRWIIELSILDGLEYLNEGLIISLCGISWFNSDKSVVKGRTGKTDKSPQFHVTVSIGRNVQKYM